MFITLKAINIIADKTKDADIEVNVGNIALMIKGQDHTQIILTMPISLYGPEHELSKHFGNAHPYRLVVRETYKEIQEKILATTGLIPNMLYSKE